MITENDQVTILASWKKTLIIFSERETGGTKAVNFSSKSNGGALRAAGNSRTTSPRGIPPLHVDFNGEYTNLHPSHTRAHRSRRNCGSSHFSSTTRQIRRRIPRRNCKFRLTAADSRPFEFANRLHLADVFFIARNVASTACRFEALITPESRAPPAPRYSPLLFSLRSAAADAGTFRRNHSPGA